MKYSFKLLLSVIFLSAVTIIISPNAWSHGGGLNAQGCHNNRKTGGYHCHRKSYTASKSNLSSAKNPTRQSPRYNSPTSKVDATKVKTTQTLLSALGYYNGSIDGIMGPTTQKAIVNFSQDKNIVFYTINDEFIFKLSSAVNLAPIG